MATNENTSLSITAIVSKMISECKSQFLIKEISVFLLGSETKDPEIKGEKEIFSKLQICRDLIICEYFSYGPYQMGNKWENYLRNIIPVKC